MGHTEPEELSGRKKKIRREILALRDGMSDAERARYDAQIYERVVSLEAYGRARAVLAYVNYRSEVDTRRLIERALHDGKAVFAPKVEGEEMAFYEVHSLCDLQLGYRGIYEPRQGTPLAAWLAAQPLRWEDCSGGQPCLLLLMPGAVFDRARHRIGYGGGYYDRYLARYERQRQDGCGQRTPEDTDGHARGEIRWPAMVTAALAYDCQVLPEIPYEEHDRKPDLIVTQRRRFP